MPTKLRDRLANVGHHPIRQPRAPAEVLRQIAGDDGPAEARAEEIEAEPPMHGQTAAEPLTAAEIAFLERPEAEWSRTAAGFDSRIVRRLLATVRAGEARRIRNEMALAEERDLACEEARLWRALVVAAPYREASERSLMEREIVDKLRAIGLDPDDPGEQLC